MVVNKISLPILYIPVLSQRQFVYTATKQRKLCLRLHTRIRIEDFFSYVIVHINIHTSFFTLGSSVRVYHALKSLFESLFSRQTP